MIEVHVSGVLLPHVRRLGAAMEGFEVHASRVLGINRSDLAALNLLEHGPLPAGSIAAQLGLTTGAVTTLIDRLAGAGYVVRVDDPSDRRKVLVELQPATYEAFARVYGPCGAAIGQMEAELDDDDVGAAVIVLEHAAARLRDLVAADVEGAS